MSQVETVHNSAKSRYEAWIDGELAGFAEYQLTDEIIVFTHTEVPRRYEGQGVGSTIARFALDDVRAGGVRRVLPLCPFIKGWIARHREYADLLYGAPATTARD
ncbi:GNAT family N-acetyltransferase [Nocardioides sp. SYSU DS0663]|uniref:GNAT family N-acetyltransferase n=1 Tax=Nocardioides sp. SYSU DS0663 TaxID=3416445 RepID=UPI003F4B7165